MAVKPVLMFGNDRLRSKSEPVDFKREDPSADIGDLRDTLRFLREKEGMGRALAAPQIGVLKRIICVDTGAREMILINPLLLARSSDFFEVWDSCFSASLSFFGKVSRHRKIAVSYLSEKGERLVEEFQYDMSELLQHEIDHLEGVLFIDRLIGSNIIMRSEWEKMKGPGY
ncbi:MAG: peptide deformylase [Candidatus Latescibacteria bacterium]|nr:peptide deformylase [bacterium]MBD3423577.1 peptide deformylase [Candidatus Latescibacterota bacterium]